MPAPLSQALSNFKPLPCLISPCPSLSCRDLVDTSTTCEAEVTARISKAKGRFAQMQWVWHTRRLPVDLKMRCFRAYVLPVLLFGSETWALTQKQSLAG